MARSGFCEKLLPPWPSRRWQHWAETVCQLRMHVRKARHGSLPDAVFDPPRTQQDLTHARAVLEWLAGLTQERKRRFVTSYLTGKLATNPVDVAFRHVSEFRLWTSLIEHVKLKGAVDYLHLPNPHSRVGSRATQMDYWQHRTDVTLMPWIKPPGGIERMPDSERGRVICLHRGGESPDTDYWAHGVAWAMVGTHLLDFSTP